MMKADLPRQTVDSARMPTLFIPHGGGPCFFMEWNPADTWTRTAAFLRSIADALPRTPRALLVISAHWAESVLLVAAGAAEFGVGRRIFSERIMETAISGYRFD